MFRQESVRRVSAPLWINHSPVDDGDGRVHMHAMLCDACQQSMSGDAFEVALLRGTIVHSPDEPGRLAATQGVMAASLCTRCGERLLAILQRKLADPCPVCEVGPMRASDEQTREREGLRRAS